MKILIASNNKKKIAELRAILEKDIPDIEMLSLSDVGFFSEIVEDGNTLSENALIKANAPKSEYITVADDTGLFVDALGGAPGIYTARYAGEECDSDANINKLLASLDGVGEKERTAHFETVIACRFPSGESFCVTGRCDGTIASERLGDGGFGYDPVFVCKKTGLSFSQMGTDEKNKVSHRAKAIAAFAEEFKKRI